MSQHKVGEPVQFFPGGNEMPQAAVVIRVHEDADCCCLASFCPVAKAWVERLNVQHGPKADGPFFVCLGEAPTPA